MNELIVQPQLTHMKGTDAVSVKLRASECSMRKTRSNAFQGTLDYCRMSTAMAGHTFDFVP